MTEGSSKPDYARLMRDALLELKHLRGSLDDLKRAQTEPVAIIGMGCRLPGGVDDPESFWRLLRDGVDAIGEVPRDRWDAAAYYDPNPDAPGKMATRYGGFLKKVDEFDPGFFGISPREARSLDPQQRLLLEVTWEALELSGQSPTELYGTSTGVFIGMSTFDYALHQVGGDVGQDDLERIDGYAATGTTMSPAAGRLSYVLGLNGPSLVVDTACSSSLVATHLAVTSLRNRECDLALVGGVNLILRPEWNVNFTKAHMLAPDGRCKTFDRSADGYSRGEGCGVVVLQRLADAVAARRNVIAVIRGSAVNQDGASGGLTVPSGPSQEQVIRRALEGAGVRPGDVGYVEAHGTGTSLGDPIEVAALGNVYGPERSKSTPLRIGSVKTNVGHLEAAAGVAGLMKVALALRNQEIPPHLHFRQGNPMIDWDGLPIVVPVERTAWAREEKPRRAGISSFGFTGTNAHVVLEEAPAGTAPADPSRIAGGDAPDRPLHIVTISARTPAALRQQAGRYQDHLASRTNLPLADVAFTANTGRAHFRHRLAIVADSLSDAQIKLAGHIAGGMPAGVFTGQGADRPRLAFLFSGAGSLYPGMGRQLYDTQPTFRATVDRCDEILRRHLDRPLLDLLHASPGESFDRDGAKTAPALFAIEYALAALWKSWGIEPDLMLGDGIGEYVAACLSGVFSLEDGLALVVARGRLSESSGLTDFARVAGATALSPPNREVVSAVTGRASQSEMAMPDYWVRQATEPGGPGILHDRGCQVFVEIGPGSASRDLVPQPGPDGATMWLPSLRADGEWGQMLQSLAALYTLGVNVDWTGFDRDYSRRPVELPTYPFQRQRHWIDIRRTAPVEPRRSEATDAHQRAAAPLPPAEPDAADGCLYELAWREQPQPRVDSSEDAGRWVILSDRGELGARLASELQTRGARCTLVSADGGFTRLGDDRFSVDAGQPSDLERLWAEMLAGGPVRGVVHLWSLDAPSIEAQNLEELDRGSAVEGALHVVQTLAKANWERSPALWCVTRGAVSIGLTPPARALSLSQSPLWGFGRVVALEHPDLWGGVVDLGPDEGAGAGAEALAAELLAAQREDQVAFRDGARYVPRLVRRSGSAPRDVSLDSRGTYLVLGGVGALGRHAARWLISKGAGTVLLASRRGLATPGASQALEDLNAAGNGNVAVVRADTSSSEDVERLLGKIAAGTSPLRGIVHAAGLDARVPLADMTAEDLRSMLASKVRGGWLLHDRTRHLDLDLFVCFSSVSSIWGAPGRGHYAAANAFLDALAHERRRLGLAALSVNWGPWRGGGMATEEDLRQLERSGNSGLEPGTALRALDALTGGDAVQATVADVDWPRFRSAFEARRPRPLLSEIDVHAGSEPATTVPARADWIVRLQGLSPAQRPVELEGLVRAAVAATLGFANPGEVPVDQSVFELGMDSLRAVELAMKLQQHLGLERPIPFFDSPQVRTLSARLLEQVVLTESGRTTAVRVHEEFTARLPATGAEPQGITGYQPQREHEIFDFSRIAWPLRPEHLIEPRWRWMFVESARRLGLEPKVWLYRDAGKVVAHHGAIPVQLAVGREVVESGWFVDTMVLESHRTTATGARLVVDSNEEFDVGLSLGQTPQMRKIALQLGWHQVAALQTFVLLLQPQRVLRDKLNPILAGVAGAGLRAHQRLKRLSSGATNEHLAVSALDLFGARHDRLWDAVRLEYPCAVKRDASYLNWKYVSQPGPDYVRLEFTRQDGAAAVAVLAIDEPGVIFNYRRAMIVDLIVSPSDSKLVLAVLDAIRERCAAAGVDAIFFHLVNARLEKLVEAYGFLRRQPTRFLLVNPQRTSSDVRRQLVSADQWLITMGDSDIDRPWEVDGVRVQLRTTPGPPIPSPLPPRLDASTV